MSFKRGILPVEISTTTNVHACSRLWEYFVFDLWGTVDGGETDTCVIICQHNFLLQSNQHPTLSKFIDPLCHSFFGKMTLMSPDDVDINVITKKARLVASCCGAVNTTVYLL